ncbi:Por secretion system C-terminal sorting domain-containing protein [Flexibacter flexilis DSM 6793]|uniref:Por secretion system C-terminal sorting domain-containing protein n=1 Tax=Flexibacter flexilis DSM 6793 TaxID=927664 RepID=A0A1I1N097_9BACT|nr:T9SS type A sorting domain-containing protein [Flexibacter flexilis]SFC87220.1 Por secretion system C-terminal sorting domain-containing protein [Flexibacter flexilis DSM 6793]
MRISLFTQLFCIVLILFVPTLVLAATCTSNGSGNWTNPLNWSCGRIPIGGDIIIIQAGHVVNVDAQITIVGSPVRIENYGELHFVNGRKLNLPAGSGVIMNSPSTITKSTGGGSSTLISIGGTDVWTAADGNVICPNNCNGFGNQNVLPVTLLYLKSVIAKSGVTLLWATASETNNSHFMVERSGDGQTYKAIAEVKGMGNSNSTTSYTYTDHEQNNGIVYYRLAQYDYDGKLTYSRAVATHQSLSQALSVSFSAEGTATLVATETPLSEVELFYTDAMGRSVYQTNLAVNTGSVSSVAPPALSQGVYLVQVRAANETNTYRVFVR